MSDITKDPTNGWTAYAETAVDGTAALLAQVIAQAERDITLAIRQGYVTAGMQVLKRPESDMEDYQAPHAVAFLKSSAAAELCAILVTWAGGDFDLRPAKRLAKALDEATRPSQHDVRSSKGAQRDRARRMLDEVPSDWLLTRDNAVTRERLPAHFERRLDAEGPVRGKTWRMMPRGTAQSREMQAMNWALHKRGIEVFVNPDGSVQWGAEDERRAA
jgi:hypothetical protein